MKKTKSILIFLTLFILLVNNAVYAQISTKEIDALVEKAMKKFNVAGVAVAVVKDGKIIHEKGYGVRSIDSNSRSMHTPIFKLLLTARLLPLRL